MENKRVIVIGAGIAGLSSALYLRMNGYEVEVLEAHDLPGGLCTSWRRGAYTFDGCIHFLLGSGEGTPLHGVWKELIDLDAIEFVNHEQLFDIEVGTPDARGDTMFHIYADADRMERYLLEAAPEDARPIRAWMRAVRRLTGAVLPPLRVPAEVRTWRDRMTMLGLVPYLPLVFKWGRLKAGEFAEQFRSPFMKTALTRLFGTYGDAAMLIFMLQQAWNHRGCAGYPIGGSLAFARRFEARLEALGGTIRYRARVAEILVEDDAAVGVRLEDGTELPADVVVSAADGRWTLYGALGGRYLTPQLEALYAGRSMPTFPSLVYVSLGLNRPIEKMTSPQIRYYLETPWVLPDGTEVTLVPIHDHGYDPTLAPEGHTTVSVMLETRGYAYWKDLRENDPAAYRAAKREVAEGIVDLLEARLEVPREAVEVVDVATPATFQRYTNNFEGSYEGWLPLGDVTSLPSLPRELPGLRGFHMVGQWVEPGGGLPPAALHGRDLARVLCHRDGRPFRVLSPSGPRDGEAVPAGAPAPASA